MSITASNRQRDERYDLAALTQEQTPPVPRAMTRKEARDLRRQQSYAEATEPIEQLHAAYDYFRGVVGELAKQDPATADRIRREVADSLMMAGKKSGRR